METDGPSGVRSIFVSFISLPDGLTFLSCSPGICICDCPFWIICGKSDEIGMQSTEYRIRAGGLREYHLLRTLNVFGW